jgi:hypothetical protein
MTGVRSSAGPLERVESARDSITGRSNRRFDRLRVPYNRRLDFAASAQTDLGPETSTSPYS